MRGTFFTSESTLKKIGCSHIIPQLRHLREFLVKHDLDINTFSIKAVQHKAKDSILILGVENEKQLLNNLDIIQNKEIPYEILEEWWNSLPKYNKEILDISMWG